MGIFPSMTKRRGREGIAVLALSFVCSDAAPAAGRDLHAPIVDVHLRALATTAQGGQDGPAPRTPLTLT